MRIVILGAGQVGSTLAETLAKEGHEITLVDQNPEGLSSLQERADIRVVQGHAAHPSTLKRAGGQDAELVIAVTESDETNMLACKVAHIVFHSPTKIARVRSSEYLEAKELLFSQDALAVDIHIAPEQLVTDYIYRMIEHPNALEVADFFEGQVRLIAIRAHHSGLISGRSIKELSKHLQGLEMRIAAIYRRDRPRQLDGNAEIEADDEVFFVCAREDAAKITAELRRQEKPVKRVLIAGGGNVGLRLAKILEKQKIQVKIIEKNRDRAKILAEQLENTVILHGDAANDKLLREEGIEDVDFFCAITNDDEANILSAMLAKQMGAKRVAALINRVAYLELIQKNRAIDVAISPQMITVSSVLAHVRKGDIEKVHNLRNGTAEAMEVVLHGDKGNSKLIGRRFEELKLPPNTTIPILVRQGKVIAVHHDTLIEEGDHAIIFNGDKKNARALEGLLSVGLTFV
jgi:trk system potassium uptake protein TrkA